MFGSGSDEDHGDVPPGGDLSRHFPPPGDNWEPDPDVALRPWSMITEDARRLQVPPLPPHGPAWEWVRFRTTKDLDNDVVIEQ